MNYRSKISDCDKNNKNNQYMKQNGNFFLKNSKFEVYMEWVSDFFTEQASRGSGWLSRLVIIESSSVFKAASAVSIHANASLNTKHYTLNFEWAAHSNTRILRCLACAGRG